jgi:hypothetical protein
MIQLTVSMKAKRKQPADRMMNVISLSLEELVKAMSGGLSGEKPTMLCEMLEVSGLRPLEPPFHGMC